jgi:hypothetical protein
MATKAQKENQARFKAVQAEAKKLKAKNPRLAHTTAVKQAWAILYAKSGKTKAPAKKAAAKKKVGAVKAKAPIKRKVAPKKKVATKSYHKDTQSHNVSVRVMSGMKEVDPMPLISMDVIGRELYRLENRLRYLDQEKRATKSLIEKKVYSNAITIVKNQLKGLSAYLNTRAKFTYKY